MGFPFARAKTAVASTYSDSGEIKYRAAEPSDDFLSARSWDFAPASSFSASFILPVWTLIIDLEDADMMSLLSFKTLSLRSSWSEKRDSMPFSELLTLSKGQ